MFAPEDLFPTEIAHSSLSFTKKKKKKVIGFLNNLPQWNFRIWA